MIYETELNLKAVNESELLTLNLAQILEKTDSKGSNLAEKLLNIRQSFIKNNPDSSIADFTAFYQNKITGIVIENIHQNLFASLRERKFNLYEIEELEKTVTKSCIEKLYSQSKEWDKDKSEKKLPKLDYLKNLLLNAVNFSVKSNTYNSFKNTLQEVCDSKTLYISLSELLETSVLRTIIASEALIRVKDAFKKVATSQCVEDLKIYDIKIDEKLKNKVCSLEILSKADIKHLKRLKQKSFDKTVYLDFIIERKNRSLKIIDSKISEDFIWHSLNKNSDVLNFIEKNIKEVVSGDELVKEQLYKMVTNAIFADKDKDGFVDNFLSEQLILTIGIKGYKKAKIKAQERANNLKGREKLVASKVKPRIKSEFRQRWNPKGVRYYLNWDNLEHSEKVKLYDEIFKLMVAPKFDSSLTQAQRDLLALELTNYMTKYVEDVKRFSSDGQTFTERLVEDIKRAVTSGVKKEIWSDINPLD